MSAKRLQDYMMSDHVELKKNSLSSYMTTATKETDPYKQTVAGTRQAPSYVRHTLPEQGEDELTDDYVRRVTALYEQDRQLQKQTKANGTNARVQTQAEADARAAARKNYSYGQAAKSYNESRLEAKDAAQRLELGVIDEAEYARILGREAKAKETYRSEGGVTNPSLTRGAMKQYGGSLVTGLGVLSAANGFTGLSPEEMPQDAEMQKYMLSQAQKNLAGENEDINAIINKGIDISESGAKEIDTMKAGHGAVGKLLIDVAVQAEMMAADMAVNKVLGVESLAPLVARSYGGGAAEAISYRKGFSKSAAEAFGDGEASSENAEESNGVSDYARASLYGAASAGVEALTEKMFDGFAQIYGKGDSTKLVSYVAGKLAKTDAGRMAWIRMIEGMGEGVEEVVSDLVNPMLKSIYNGKGIISNYRELNAGDIAYDFLVGAILGYAGQAVEGITSPGMDDTQAFFSECARNGKSFKESCKLYESMMSAYDAWTRGEYSKDGTAEDTDTAEVLPALPVEETIEGTYTEAGETVESYEEEAPASTLTAETYAETLRNATQAEATEALDEEVAEQQQTAEDAVTQPLTVQEPVTQRQTVEEAPAQSAAVQEATTAERAETENSVEANTAAEDLPQEAEDLLQEAEDTLASSAKEAYTEPVVSSESTPEQSKTKARDDSYKQSAAYKAAVEYGRSGVPFSLLVDENMGTKLESVKSLTPAQRQEAYLEGKNSSDAEARKNLVSLDAQANGKTGWKQGSVRSDGSVKMTDLRATFNAAQNEAYDAMSAFASVTGIDIVLTKSEPDAEGFYTGANGSFNRNTNEITIDINSGIFDGMDAPQLCKYLALRTFGHELTHFTEKWSPVMYNQYREAVFEHMRANGTDVDELISRKQEQTGKSYEEASREVVAEESADIIPESSFAERLAKKNRKLFANFLSKLKEFVSKLKKSFANMVRGGSMNDALKTEVNGALRYAENIVEMYDNLVTDAVERYQRANAVEDRRVRLDDLLAKAENISEDENGKQQLSKLVEDAYERGRRKEPVTVDSLLANIGDAVEDNTGSEQLAGLVAAAYQRGQKAAETESAVEERSPERTPEEEALYKEAFEGATPEWAMGALEKAGFTRWQKGGHDRLYINAKELGLEIKYGKKAGQIDSATFRGEDISNSYARSLKSAKTYVDAKTQEVNSTDNALAQEAKTLYMETLTAAYENKLQEMNATVEEAAPQEVPKAETATVEEAKAELKKSIKVPHLTNNAEALKNGLLTKELSMDTITLGKAPAGFNKSQQTALVRELIDGYYSGDYEIKVDVPYDGKFSIENSGDNVVKVLDALQAKVNQEAVIPADIEWALKSPGIKTFEFEGASYITPGPIAIRTTPEVVEFVSRPKRDGGYDATSFDISKNEAFQNLPKRIKADTPVIQTIADRYGKKVQYYAFSQNGVTTYFNKTQINRIDGGTMYLVPYSRKGNTEYTLAAYDEKGLYGLLYPVYLADNSKIENTLPGKLKSFKPGKPVYGVTPQEASVSKLPKATDSETDFNAAWGVNESAIPAAAEALASGAQESTGDEPASAEDRTLSEIREKLQTEGTYEGYGVKLWIGYDAGANTFALKMWNAERFTSFASSNGRISTQYFNTSAEARDRAVEEMRPFVMLANQQAASAPQTQDSAPAAEEKPKPKSRFGNKNKTEKESINNGETTGGQEDSGEAVRTDHMGAIPVSESDGEGAPRLVDEHEAGDVQRAGGREEAASADSGTGEGSGRHGGENDSAGSASGRSGGDSESGVPVLSEGSEPVSGEEAIARKDEQVSTVSPKGDNFSIGESLDLPNGDKARFSANIDAIRTMHRINTEGRVATSEEQAIMSKYVGWGGLANAFGYYYSSGEKGRNKFKPNAEWEKQFNELWDLVDEGIITEAELTSMSDSTRNAHYTSIEVVKAMYTGLKRLGFSGGRIIEPSCGSGNFAGAMPADMKAGIKRFVMVDIDRVTGGIAKLLYPNYDVRIEGYQNTVLPDDYLDVAIGNVPFGNANFVDKRYPHFLTSSLHNYFFIKTLDKIRPGGIVMFITSSFTLDAATKGSVREYIASRADLLGAIRLPNTAFLENAKTSVVTDIIILKKRNAGTEYAGEPFITTKNIYNDKLGFYVAENEYFQAHPEMILGTPDKGTMYGGKNEVTYNPIKDGRSLRQQIEDAFSTITRKMDYLTPTAPEKVAVKVSTKGKERTGLYTAKDGKLFRNDGGEITLSKKDQQRLLGILSVKDAYNALVESISIGSGKVSGFRKSLNAVYDSFVATYGYLNDPANARRLVDDPDRYSILSLEKNYTPSVGSKGKPGYSPSKAEKSAIFFKDTFNAAKTITSAKDVTDAVSISMNVKGYLDIDYISRLIGQDTDSVKTSLLSRREAFLEKDGSLTPRTQYLSGNVRAKLKEAKELAAVEEAYNANVEELEAVLPEWVTPEHITVQPGARWIPVKIYSDFISDTFDGASSYVFIDDSGEYKVRSMAKGGPKDTSVWGTLDIGGLEIFERIMNHRQVKVSYKDITDGKTYVDEKATALAREYEQKLRNEFQRWLFEGKRGESITSLYNDTFNAFVTPKYDGSNLTITGIAAGVSLYEHQSNAIQRILQSGGNTLLAHAVGAGKTLEMCGAIMKLRELGAVKKPVIVAPKNLTAQWKNEFLKFFPAAKILAADDKNFDVEHRRMFANMAKNNDFDAIIMSYENFEKLPMAENYYSGFYDSLIMDAIDESNDFKIARDGKGMNAKELSKKKASLQELIDKLTQKAKDTDIPTLEEIGIDGVFVDEAHSFKNLWYITNMTNVSGLGNSKGAQRSLDMLAKIRYIQSMNGGRGIVFATATPVMNSMAEMYIMQRYLQPDRLDQMGLKTFDAWASQFGQVVIRTERDPTGQKFREKESFSNFINVGQLQQLFHSFADVITEIPGLKLPKRREVVVECPMNSFQKAYMIELGNRAQATKGHARGKKGEDNMLKITGDGRKVAYSQHLVDSSLPYEEGNKAFRCCDEVVKVYNETTGITVRDPSTGEDIVVNGTQIVFVDMGTPKGSDKTDSDKSSEDGNDPEDAEAEKLYSAMKARLIQNGVKESEIAFIHDAKTDKQKEQLFADMNSGKVRVLLGSTAKMGVGMNAQRLVVALHHVDVPWRPGDLDQREGRAIRQGNLFDEVRIFKYVALGSSDSFMWDKISWKSAMIKQVMSGTYAGDSVEDADEVTISADEMSAIATGNPLMKMLYDKQTALENEKVLVNAKYSQRNSDNFLLERNMESLRNAEADRDKALSLQKTIKENSDGEFSIKINGKVYSEKPKAGIVIDMAIASLKLDTSGELPVVFRGVTARYNAYMESRGTVVNIFYGQESFPYSKSGVGALTSLSNIAARYEDGSKVKHYEDQVTKHRENIAILEKSIAAPIDSSKIALLQDEIDEIKAQIEAGSGSEVYANEEQYQLRSKSYTDEELLSLAVAEMEEAALSAEERAQKYREEHPGKKAPVSITRDMLTGEETEALHIYENKLASIAFLQEQRDEQGRIYKENTFVKGGNREEAAAAKNRMEVLDTQLSRAKDELLEMQNKPLLRKVLSKARGVVEKMGKEDTKEALDKLRKRTAERDRKARYRKQVEANAKTIMGWLTHPDNKKAYAHVPKSIRNGVVAFMEAIDMSSKQLLNGGEATVKDRRYLKSLRELRRTVEAYAGTEDYLSFVDIPESLMPMLDELIEAAEAYTTGSEGSSFTVNTMNSDQLKALNELLVNLKRIIQRANSLHQNAVFAHVDEAAQSTIKELSSVKNSEAGTAQRLNSFSNFDIVRPTRIFKRFGKGGESIAKELMQGQDRLAYNAKAIVDFAVRTFSGKEVREWRRRQVIVQLGGEEVKMTETQLMCLYEIYKDPDGKRKLTSTDAGGGLKVATYEQDGAGRFGFRKKVQVTDEGRSHITDSELKEAFKKLSPRQIEVADAIQSFIAKHGGGWLNEISLIRFGEIAAIVGDRYFPNSTDPTLLGMTEDAERKFTSPYAMLNKNFTKSRKDNASARLIVYDIFDVLIDHMGQMAEYNAFALPVLDTLKWLNYSEVNDSGEVTASVKGSLNAAFGQKGNSKPGSTADGIAVQFVKDILRGINNATQNAVDADAIYNKLLHRGNKAKVAFNVRVAFQQPLAIIRAGEYLKTGEILRGVKELASQPKLLRAAIAEMEAHSGIATWKVSLGYYDTNISEGLAAQVKQDPSFTEKLDEIGMKGAETADTVTWAAMWNACKAAVQNRGIKEDDTGYWDSVTELFETIIYDTQVVDSVLTKARFMRSNATVNRALSSFMGESVATYSMLEDAYYRFRTDAKRMGTAAAFAKHRNKIFRAFAIYGISALAEALVTGLYDAWRDDDDYQTFLQKFAEHFKDNFKDTINPLEMIPVVNKLWESACYIACKAKLGGEYAYKPSDFLTDTLDGIVGTIESLLRSNKNYTGYRTVYYLLNAFSDATGVAAASLMREVSDFWNNTFGAFNPELKLKTYDAGAKKDIQKAFKDGWIGEEDAAKKLVEDANLSIEDASELAAAWATQQEFSKLDLSESEAKGYNRIRDKGIDIKTYISFRDAVKGMTGEDENGDGKTDSGSVRNKVVAYIAKLPLLPYQKDALYLSEGYAESKLADTPWH